MSDTGNNNFFTTFKGKYELTLTGGAAMVNKNVMVTCINDVLFLSSITKTASIPINMILAILPEECRPSRTIKLEVTGSGGVRGFISIGSDGYIRNGVAISTADDGLYTLYTNGLSFNISDRWY